MLAALLFCLPAMATNSQVDGPASARSAESVCASSKGIWNTSNDTCAVTKAACEGLGEWEDGLGCVLPSINAAECNGGEGMQAIGSACVIIYMTVDETTQ
jgi:hypothetical protein